MAVASFTVAAVAVCALLLVASAFFSSAEIAAFTLQRHRIESLAATGDVRARALEALREDPNRLLVTILVGNNVVNVAFSTIVAALTVSVVPAGPAIVVATVVTSVLVLLVGEVAPKAYGVAHAESWALTVARPVTALERLLAPVVWAFDAVADALTSLAGAASDPPPYVTREEIRALLVTGARLGVVDADEREMVHAVLDLEETPVADAMTERDDLVVAAPDAAPADVRDACLDRGVELAVVADRDPTGDVGTVRGTVTLADVARAANANETLDAALRPALTVDDAWTLDDLVGDFREYEADVAVVTDHGTLAGVVTRDAVAEAVLWRGR